MWLESGPAGDGDFEDVFSDGEDELVALFSHDISKSHFHLISKIVPIPRAFPSFRWYVLDMLQDDGTKTASKARNRRR